MVLFKQIVKDLYLSTHFYFLFSGGVLSFHLHLFLFPFKFPNIRFLHIIHLQFIRKPHHFLKKFILEKN